MKKLEKLKKNTVINTEYVEKTSFNDPLYIIDANKEFVKVFNVDKKGKIKLINIKIEENLNKKTFITIKEFFKKCQKDDSEYKIEKVNNGDVYIRVAYFGDVSLFFKINETTKKLFITNIKKYKFYKTNNNIQQTLNKLNYLSYYEKMRTEAYLKNLKNVKRDYLFQSKKSLEVLKQKLAKQ